MQESLKPSKFERLRRWVKRLALSFALLVLVLAVVGAVYQYLSTARDLQRFPPPGRLVDAGGHRLHIHCSGAGSPTVVLDSGFDDTMLVWWAVQPEVAKFTRVCSYDRAGVGWSDAGPTPTHSRQMVGELHTLLKNAGVSDSYALVGASFGGLNARVFASQYPDETAGMVLVDSMHEDQFARTTGPKGPPPAWLKKLARGVGWIGGTTGLGRILGSAATSLAVPPEVKPMAYAVSLRTEAYTAGAKIEGFQCLDQARATKRSDGQPPLGDKPLVVLTHGKRGELGAKDSDERAWVEMQDELARLSSNSKHLFLEKSGHRIVLDQPEAVVEAIHQVVEAVRRRKL
jgi:pimeloyl-ACP methyl ester carboxylesterase